MATLSGPFIWWFQHWGFGSRALTFCISSQALQALPAPISNGSESKGPQDPQPMSMPKHWLLSSPFQSFWNTHSPVWRLWQYPAKHIKILIEGSLEVKLPTIWTDGKAEVGRVREEKRRSEDQRRERERRKKMQGTKGRKVAIHCFFFNFQWFCSSGWSKSRLAKAAGAEPAWREAHVQVKMYKTRQVRTTFGSWDVEKVHAVVARSTFPSQNAQSTPFSNHFWKVRCRKSARRCGAKHISKSKCTKHTILRPLLEVEMSKKCTPLWREAYFQVKMWKAPHARTTVWRSNGKSVRRCGVKHIWKSKVSKTGGFEPFLTFRCPKSHWLT